MTIFLTALSSYIATGGDHVLVRQAREFRSRARFKDLYVSSFAYLRSLVLGYTEVNTDPTSVTRVNEAFDIIINVVDDGDSTGILPTYAESVGVTQNGIDAKDHLQANKDFIVAEFIAYLDTLDNTLTYTASEWEAYVENFVDALSYDILYGGNNATVQETTWFFKSVTWSNFTNTNQQAFEDSFARLRFIVQRIVRGLSVAKTSGNAETQDFTSGDATQIEATLLDGLVQIIESVIDAQSVAGLPTKSYPNIEEEPAGQVNAANKLLSVIATIITDTIDYNLTNNPTLTYNEEKCKRDVGYMVDAVYRDAQLGTNQNSITAGLSYNRANVAYLNGEQKPATIIALREAKRLTLEQLDKRLSFKSIKIERHH